MPSIEFIPLSLVDDYDKNSNTHPQAQIENIKALMLYVGWTVPALVRKTGERYGLIAGHGRRCAANELQGKPLKMADGTPIPAGCIPVLFADGWSDEQIRAYVIADNQVPRQSVFDESILAEELQALQDGGLDLGMIGFGEVELERLLASIEPEPEYQTDPDDAPEVDEESTPVSVLGMVWLCGNHRVMCGDSTSPEDVRKLMNGNIINLVFTDPPYGIEIVSNSTVGGGGETKFGSVGGGKVVAATKYREIKNDDSTDVAKHFYNICSEMSAERYVIWGGNYFTDFLYPSMCWAVWDKQNTGNFADVELAWCSEQKGAKLYPFLWNGMSREGDRKTEGFKRVHPTQKPVGLFVKMFEDFSGNNVLDGFGGSGSTLIACEKTTRNAFILEFEEYYVDVIVKRWQQFTGKQATLEHDGRTFNEIASLCP